MIIKSEIESSFDNVDIFMNELGDLPGWWNTHKTSFFGSIGIAILVGLLNIILI